MTLNKFIGFFDKWCWLGFVGVQFILIIIDPSGAAPNIKILLAALIIVLGQMIYCYFKAGWHYDITKM